MAVKSGQISVNVAAECLEARFVAVMHVHVPPCLCVLQLWCARSVHVSWRAHMCICVSGAGSSMCRVIPRCLNLRAERTSFFHLAQMCQELKSSEADVRTTSHSQSKHDTSRRFNGQWRVPVRLRKPLIPMFSRCQQQFFRRQKHLATRWCVKLVQSLTRT